MNVDDPTKLSLSNFLGGESDDPLQPPPSFTNWMQLGAWAVELYEPELLSSADARTTINYAGKPRQVINLCSYNSTAHAPSCIQFVKLCGGWRGSSLSPPRKLLRLSFAGSSTFIELYIFLRSQTSQ